MLPTIVRYEIPKLLAAQVRYEIDNPGFWTLVLDYLITGAYCLLISALILSVLIFILFIVTPRYNEGWGLFERIDEYFKERERKKKLALKPFQEVYMEFKKGDFVYRLVRGRYVRGPYTLGDIYRSIPKPDHVKITQWIYNDNKDIVGIVFSDGKKMLVDEIVLTPGKKVKNHLPGWF